MKPNRLAVESLEPRLLLSSYTALQRPTELQYWDSTDAYNGYNFYGAGGTSYLLDMDGRVVHTWPLGTNPHLLTAAEGYSGSAGDVLDFMNGSSPSGATGLEEVNWNGTVVWSYTNTRSNYHLHHDFERIYDPDLQEYTTIFIANKDYTYAQCVAAGADPSTTPSTGAQMDTITEVDQSGNIVWEWDFFDHLIQDEFPTEGNYAGAGETVADYPGKLDIDMPGHPLKDDWLHCNSLDFNQSLDQIVINSVQGEFYVINHGGTIVPGNPTASIAKAATSAGDFLYRFGDPADYGQGTAPSITGITSSTGTKQLGGSHDIQWIPAGLPGAGDFLVFNNAEYLSQTTPQSYVEEINPYLNSSGVNTGSYVNPPDAGYNTVTPAAVTDKTSMLVSKQVVWDWSSQSNLTLYNDIGGSAQRLPNGNTLICSDVWGYITEVTPSDKTVWDYIVPVVAGTGAVLTLGDRLPYENSIFRAYCYGSSDPTIAGYTLTPGATIAGRTTVSNPYAGTSDYEALQRQTEVQYWDPTDAYNGYTFFAAQGTTYLIDMQGRVVHTWDTGDDPCLLDDGDVLDWTTDTSGDITGLQELDWNSDVVWSYTETNPAYHLHGDFERIFDPDLNEYTTLFLANKDETYAQLVAAGANPATTPSTGGQMDAIVEVDMSGNVVWEWDFFDHLVQDQYPSEGNYAGSGKTVANYPGKLNINLTGIPLSDDWLDCNSIDFNQSLDQIVVNSSQGEFYIISHGNTIVAGNPAASIALAATSAGDFLYRFGDPARYDEGTSPAVEANWEDATTGDKQIGGSSDVQWIPAGLPGAGDLLVFDNNQYLFERSPYSFVFQIDPYRTSSGTDSTSYVDPSTAGYTTEAFGANTMDDNQPLSNQVVWKYSSQSYLTLFSQWDSSAQRLPNGDTLICSSVNGYMVEVDSSGNVVWEYINPVTNAGIVTAIGDCLPMTNAVPKATRYAASFAGFQGHSLTPGATIAGTVYPAIADTTCTPLSPSASSAPWVTARITDASGVAGATLTYSTGSGTGTATTPFTESFGSTAAKPWTGGSTGTNNAWTVTGNYLQLATNCNYDSLESSTCGMTYKGTGTANSLTGAMMATTNSINAAGTSGYVQFYLQESSLSGTDGWTFQVDPTGTGNGYVTCLSDSTFQYNNQGWQKFDYTLTSTQLVSTLKMRFQFSGGGSSDTGRIFLDDITVNATVGGLVTTTVTMYDDGAHGDGAAGDGVYGAQIPAQATGTTVSYYVTATDSSGLVANDPTAAPSSTYSYTVGATTTSLAFGSTASGTYGGTATLAATLIEGGLALGNKIVTFSLNGASVGTATTNTNGVATLADVSLTGISVGTYTADVGASFAGDSTYAASIASANLTVTAAPLTITADDQTMVYGSTAPTLTASYSGFVNGDTSLSLTTQPTLSTAATSASPIGSYAITASGAVDSNYTISYVLGTLTVVPITWSFDESTQLTFSNALPAGSPVGSITFNADAGAFVLDGNSVDLYGDITNQSQSTQTVNLPLTLVNGNSTLDTAAGNVTIFGNIEQSGGECGITKTGPATLTLSGTNSYQGVTVVAEGTLIETSSSALPDGGSLIVGAGGILVFDPGAAASTSGSMLSDDSKELSTGGNKAAVASVQAPVVDVQACTLAVANVAQPATGTIHATSAASPAVGKGLGESPALASLTAAKAPLKWFNHTSSTDATGIAKAHDAVLTSFVPRIHPAAATAWLWASEDLSGNQQQANRRDPAAYVVDDVLARFERRTT